MGKTYDIGPRQNFLPLPTGEYVLTLKSWEERTEEQDSQYSKKGDTRLELTWIVAVPNDEPATRKARLSIPMSWNEKSNFVHAAEALRLVDHEKAIAEGAHVNWDMGIGKSCTGIIVKKLKEGKTDEWTDSITAYAPLPQNAQNAPVGAPERTAGTGLVQRYQRLIKFAGTADTVPEGLSSLEVAGRMKLLGAGDMTDHAVRQLKNAMELWQMATDDPVPAVGVPQTLKDGLLALDKIETALGALD